MTAPAPIIAAGIAASGELITTVLDDVLEKYDSKKYILVYIKNGMPAILKLDKVHAEQGSVSSSLALGGTKLPPNQYTLVFVEKPGGSKAIEAYVTFSLEDPYVYPPLPSTNPVPNGVIAIRVPNSRGFNQYYSSATTSNARFTGSWSSYSDKLKKVYHLDETVVPSSWPSVVNAEGDELRWEAEFTYTESRTCVVTVVLRPQGSSMPLSLTTVEPPHGDPPQPLTSPYTMAPATVGNEYGTYSYYVNVDQHNWASFTSGTTHATSYGNYTFVANALPSWLEINSVADRWPAVLQIYGKDNQAPSEPGDVTFTVNMNDGAEYSRSGSMEFTVPVVAAP